jgi:hypothetical protein
MSQGKDTTMGAHVSCIVRIVGAPVVAVLLVTGAATVTSAPAPADPGGTLDYQWSVENRTSQPIALQMSADDGGLKSGISYSSDAPMMPGTITSTLQKNPGTFAQANFGGRFCYSGAWWTLPSGNYGSDNRPTHAFTLLPSQSDPAALRVFVGAGSNEPAYLADPMAYAPLDKGGPC